MGEQEGHHENIPWWHRRPFQMVVGVLVVVLVGLFVAAPWFYDGEGANTAAATTRAGILAVIAASIAAGGATLALVETRRANLETNENARKALEETQRANRDADQRERYTRAIDQLGHDSVDVRLGGIYSLQRIAQKSGQDLPTVVEVLCAFVREHGQGPNGDSDDAMDRHRQATDVQAALLVIKRVHDADRGSYIDLQEAHIERATLTEGNLAGANLRGAKLTGAILCSANLADASLQSAQLHRADLTPVGLLAEGKLTMARPERADLIPTDLNGANLSSADLTRSYLIRADLSGAKLGGANLTAANLSLADLTLASLFEANLTDALLVRANLGGAYLRGADLTGANLRKAELAGADLSSAEGLTQDQLEHAQGDEATELPPGLTRPEHWSPQSSDSADEAAATIDGSD